MHFESASFKMIDLITCSIFDPGPMPPRYDTTDYRPKPAECNISHLPIDGSNQFLHP